MVSDLPVPGGGALLHRGAAVRPGGRVQLERLHNLQQLVQVEVGDRLAGAHAQHVRAEGGLGGIGGGADAARAVQGHGDYAAAGEGHLEAGAGGAGVGGRRRQAAVLTHAQLALIHLEVR